MTTGIYKITNTQTQKSYVGQSENIEARIGSHLTDCFGKGIQRELYTALRQFGINNFTFEIIEECPTHLLDEKEAFWIKFYDSHVNGYNMTEGYFNIPVVKYSLQGEKIAEYPSLTKAGELNNIPSSYITNVCKGNTKTAGGAQWRYKKDKIEKLPPVQKGGKTGPKRVAQFKNDKLIKVYNSASEADTALKVSKGSVSKAVRGIQHTVKGFTFEYVEDCENG